jgi:hypothetical protein
MRANAPQGKRTVDSGPFRVAPLTDQDRVRASVNGGLYACEIVRDDSSVGMRQTTRKRRGENNRSTTDEKAIQDSPAGRGS